MMNEYARSNWTEEEWQTINVYAALYKPDIRRVISALNGYNLLFKYSFNHLIIIWKNHSEKKDSTWLKIPSQIGEIQSIFEREKLVQFD